VVATAAVPALGHAQVEAVLQRFRGEQSQVPPMYSALKRDGQPLYRLARAGVEVERAARPIRIDELTLQSLTADALELETLCSKGTYVRTLAEDIASALGTCGHVIRLRRLYVEPFASESMQTLEAIESERAAGRMPPLIGADAALPALPPVALDAAAAARLSLGQTVAAPLADVVGRVRLYDDQGRFLGLGEADGHGAIRPKRLFVM
jgi:tRNA pseudouridine55 synthase